MANLFLIRELCKEKKIPFKDVCERIGISPSAVHHSIRCGSTKVSTLEDISRVLGVSPGYFFDGYSADNDAETYLKEIKSLKELVAEKERTIQILMEERKLLFGKK